MIILTEDEVRNIANLAMLSLSKEEIKKYTSQLASILEYVKILDDIDVSEELDQSDSKLKNVLRADKVTSSLTVQESLSGKKDDLHAGYFVINSVIVNDDR